MRSSVPSVMLVHMSCSIFLEACQLCWCYVQSRCSCLLVSNRDPTFKHLQPSIALPLYRERMSRTPCALILFSSLTGVSPFIKVQPSFYLNANVCSLLVVFTSVQLQDHILIKYVVSIKMISLLHNVFREVRMEFHK